MKTVVRIGVWVLACALLAAGAWGQTAAPTATPTSATATVAKTATATAATSTTVTGSLVPTPTAPAETQDANLGAIGMSYQPGGSPALAGTGMYARQVTSSTYAFGVLDAIPEAGVKPFTVDTGIAAGIAQRVVTIGIVDLYIPLAAGFTYTGSNAGWQWSTGALGVIPIGKTPSRILPNFRALKSSVGSKQGYVLTFGVMFGWGWK